MVLFTLKSCRLCCILMMPFELPQPGLCLCFYGKLTLKGFNRDTKELSHNETSHKKNLLEVMYEKLIQPFIHFYTSSLPLPSLPQCLLWVRLSAFCSQRVPGFCGRIAVGF